jgi:hypothetical protein
MNENLGMLNALREMDRNHNKTIPNPDSVLNPLMGEDARRKNLQRLLNRKKDRKAKSR